MEPATEKTRWRDRVKNNIKANEIQKTVVSHWKEHKDTYIKVGCILAGAGFTCAIMRETSSEPITVAIGDGTSGAIGVAGKKVVMSNVSFISSNRQGSPSWVVRCVETGEVETSQKKMAQAMEIPSSKLSEHLNGKREHVDGKHFERLCVAG